MLSLRPLRRPRRPSNTWMEVDLPLKCTRLFLIQKLLTDSMRECDGNSHFLLYDSIGSTWVLLFCFSLWFFTPFLEIRWLFTDSWFSAVRDPESNKNYSAMMVLLTFVTICVFPLLIFFLNKLISFYCRIIFNILWFLFCSQVRLMGRRSLLQLFLPSVFALPLVDFLRPVECLRHRLCGAEAPRAWGEGMLIKGCVLFKVFLLSQAVWTLHPSRIFPYFCVTGLDLRGGGPQHGAVPAPDHPVAGVTALVPAPTPPDRPVFSPETVFFVSILYLIRCSSWFPSLLDSDTDIWIVANMNISLHVESVLFFIFVANLSSFRYFVVGWRSNSSWCLSFLRRVWAPLK